MRRSKEIIILFVLLVVSASSIIWYVVDRRARNRSAVSSAAIKSSESAHQLGPVAVEPPQPHFEVKPVAETKVEAAPASTKPNAILEASASLEPASPTLIALAPSKIEQAAEIPPVKATVAPLPEPAPKSAPVQTTAPAPVAKNPSEPSPKSEPAATKPADETVELGGENEGKTIDFSQGQPVTGTSPEEKAIIEKAVKDMAEARKKVVFKANEKIPAPAPAPEQK